MNQTMVLSCPLVLRAPGIEFQPRFFARYTPFDGVYLAGAGFLSVSLPAL